MREKVTWTAVEPHETQGNPFGESAMPVEAPSVSAKQLVFETLRRLPDEATLEQISEEIAILVAIRRGQAAADAGQVISHEEVKRRSGTWTST